MTLRLLPLLAAARRSAATAVAAGNRNRVPTATATSPNANQVRVGAIRYTAPLNCGLSTLGGAWANFFAVSSGGESSAGLPSFNLTLSLDYPVGQATRQRITIGGQDTALFAPGDLKFQDLLTVNIAPGDVYDIYWQKETLGAGGGTYTMLTNQFYGPGRGDRLTSSASTADRTLTGTVAAVAALTADYGPTLLYGEPAVAGYTCIHVIGDSRAWGTGDKAGTTSQGDYLPGTSPAAPFINIGNTGWIERAIAGRHGLFNLAVPGRQAASFTQALNAKNFAVAAKTRPTHVILAACVNDLLASGAGATTAANVILRNQAIQAYYRATYPGVKTVWPTCSPVAASSDAWASLGNQSLSGTVAGIATPNWANFTDNTGASGRSFYNAQVRANTVGADMILDQSALVEDPSDGRFWKSTGGNARTNDGIHESQLGHTEASASLNPVLFDPPSSASRLLLEGGSLLLLEDSSQLLLES